LIPTPKIGRETSEKEQFSESAYLEKNNFCGRREKIIAR
jgi:hypothetical protein